MRTFEIPAMGGLMLTSRTAEQQEFFPENEACYMYADVAELKEKIEYILANKQEADRVRSSGAWSWSGSTAIPIGRGLS